MLAKDIMSKLKLFLTPDNTVQDFISIMEKNYVHEAFVLDGKKLVGMVDYKMLANKSILDPSQAKIRSVMSSHPKKISPEDELEKIADFIFKSGSRALPVVDKGSVVGVISTHDVIRAAAKSKIFEMTTAEKIMVEPVTIKDDTEIGKARAIMRERGISRLPVINNMNKIIGIVTVFDLLKAMKPRERMGWYSMAAEMDKIMRIPVSTIMDTSPVTATSDKKLSDIANIMGTKETSGIIIIEDGMPKGVITIKDLLEVFTSQQKQEGIYCQIIGLSDEDSFIVDSVYRMVEETAKKISYMYKPDFVFIHVKKYETGMKNRIKYSVRARIRTNKGIFMSKAWGWDLRDAVGEALDSMEKIIIKKRETKKDKIRNDLIMMKRRR